MVNYAYYRIQESKHICARHRLSMQSNHIPLASYHAYPLAEMQARATAFYEEMRRRRTVRDFSDRPVPRAILETCLRTAGTAPSGANQQPWHFVIVSDPAVKRQIRQAAEAEEQEFYARRASQEWLEALAPLGTDAHKPFLETAPYLVAIFAQVHGVSADGNKIKHYYVTESVGIATGLLIAALHHAGLATLTHTPSPMGFLNEILARPANERPFLLLVVGYPAENAHVPAITKKSLDDIATFV
jgi:iodotyrosine deiodinase